MYLDKLLEDVEILEVKGEGNPDITGVAYNSNEITEGGLFVAIEGFKTDGHKYVPSAVSNGAGAIVCTKFTPDLDVLQIKVADARIAEAKISANFFGNPSKKL